MAKIEVQEPPEQIRETAAAPFLTGQHVETVQRAMLIVARRYPAFAAAANMAIVVDSRIHPEPISSMAIDGFGHIYVNAEWIEGKKPEDLVFAVAHTLLHPMLWHMARQGVRTKERFFRAADRGINLALRDMGFQLPQGAILPLRPEHNQFTVEQLYEVEPEGEPGGGGDGKGKGQGQSQAQGQGQGANGEGEGDGQPNPGEGCGMVGPAAPEFDQQKLAQNQFNWQMAVHHAANTSAGHTPGRNPLGVLLAPPPARVRWGTLIRNVCIDVAATQGRDDITWSKLHRRSFDSDILRPHPISGHGALALLIDSSGSVSDQSLWQVVSECVEIQRQHHDARLFLVVHDAEVTFAGWLDKEPVTAQSVSKRIVGRGGTIFRPGYERIEAEPATFDAFIHFTDACPFDPWPKVPKNVRGHNNICALISYAVASNVPSYLRKVFVELDQ